MSGQSDAIVIGAGISGLTAQYLLSTRGKKVTLIAPADAGGMLRTERKDGFTLEQGPNVILEKPEISKLIDLLDLRGEIVYPLCRYRQFIAWGEKTFEMPKGPLQFLRSGLFSLREKIRIVRALFGRDVFAAQASEESVLDFFSRGLGEEVARRVLDPVLKGIYGGQIDKLSAEALFPALYPKLISGMPLTAYLRERRAAAGRRPDIFVVRGGMEAFARRLLEKGAENVTWRRVAAVSIGRAGEVFRVTDGGGALHSAPRLIIAMPLRQAVPLLTEDLRSDALQRAAQNRRYAPLTIVHCAAERIEKFERDVFGVLYPAGSEHALLGAMFNSFLFPHVAPSGRQLITLCFGGMDAYGKTELLNPDSSVIRELCRVKLGAENIELLSRHSWENAIPQYEAGHRSLSAAVAEIEQRFPGVSFATVDRGGVGVADRVKSVMELLGNE